MLASDTDEALSRPTSGSSGRSAPTGAVPDNGRRQSRVHVRYGTLAGWRAEYDLLQRSQTLLANTTQAPYRDRGYREKEEADGKRVVSF